MGKLKKSVILGNDEELLEQARTLKALYLPMVEKYFRTDGMIFHLRDFLQSAHEIEETKDPEKIRLWLFTSFVAINGNTKYGLMDNRPAPLDSPNRFDPKASLDRIERVLAKMHGRIEEIATHLGIDALE